MRKFIFARMLQYFFRVIRLAPIFRGVSSVLWVVDKHAFRREAIVANLTSLGEESGLVVRDVEDGAHILPENIKDPSVSGQQVCLFGIGGQPLDHPDVVSTVRNLRQVLGTRPLVLLVERADSAKFQIARELGIRGIVETSMPGLVVIAVLEHVRNGEEYFPNVTPAGSAPATETNAARLPDTPVHREKDVAAQVSQKADANGPCAPNLTERQKEVVRYVCMGNSNKVIARKLGVSEATVKVHIRHVLKKFNASNRTQIAIRASDGALSAAFTPNPSRATVPRGALPAIQVKH